MRRNGKMYGTGNAVYSRCVRCGRGGARCFYGGRVHKACLDPDERKDYDRKLLASFKPTAFPITPRPRYPSNNSVRVGEPVPSQHGSALNGGAK